MPKMGESLQEGTIIRWLKNPGDTVERDEMILEISTDKVDTEVPSPVSGTLAVVFANANETIPVGQKIAEIETEANASITPSAPAPQAAPIVEAPKPIETSAPAAQGSTVEVVMPKMGESLQEGTIIRWLKNVGEKVERDEMILEISTDKVDTEVPSPVSGTLIQIMAQANETIEVGKAIAIISTGDAPAIPAATPQANAPAVSAPAPAPVAANTTQTMEIPRKYEDKFFSPLVRTIAEQEKVSLEELNTIKGSGIEGRITKDDLLNYLKSGRSAQASAPTIAAPAPAPQAITKAPEVLPATRPTEAVAAPKVYAPAIIGSETEVIPMDRMRQLISEHMVSSVHTSPHVTSVAEVDMTEIVKFRNKYKNEFEKREGIKLTFTPFFAKAAVEAVKQNPMINSSVDGTNILRHRRINLSFATALPDGNLIVPVIKNADNLNITGLARSVYDLSNKARTKKLNPDDIQGGTFTITNVGTFGTLFGSPIINQPQVAIMSIGAIQKRPVAREFNGEYVVVVRDMCYVSLTYDHRIVDGMLGGKCLSDIVKSLESMKEGTIEL
jgi:2-oxoglutarate dehydrogenase E2 component (dihydrolipoamide succinyltransferase)